MFRIDAENRKSEKIEEVEFSQLGFGERQDIQEWIAQNPSILDDDLLIIAKEFSGFDQTNDRLDLLAVDMDAKLVVIELKRDDSGKDAHWQAIKYASYLHNVSSDEIIRMLAAYETVPESTAADKLLEHIESSNFEALNNDQRIILASHRFAPEVVSAAVWVNEKSHADNLITCVQLTPYRDDATGSLYIHTNTIIPVPGVDDYIIQIGNRQREAGRSISGFTENMRRTKNKNRSDDVTRFLREVAKQVRSKLPNDLKPDRNSNWAGDGGGHNSGRRHYNMWYSYEPWGNWSLSYRINLWDELGRDGRLKADVGFGYSRGRMPSGDLADEVSDLADAILDQAQLDGRQEDDKYPGGTWRYVEYRYGDNLDESFARCLANTLIRYIKEITPLVNRWNADDEDA